MKLGMHYPVGPEPPWLEDETGRKWREATPKELAELAPDALVLMTRGLEGTAKPAGEYASLRFPGNYPYLPGLAALGMPVYIEKEKS